MKIKTLLLINSFWSISVVLLFRFLNLFKELKIIKIRSDRIGYFVPDGAEQVAKFQTKSKKL